jgi:hypothetical protein
VKLFDITNYHELEKINLAVDIIAFKWNDNFYLLKCVDVKSKRYAFLNIAEQVYFNHTFEDILEMCEEIIERYPIKIIRFDSYFEFIDWLYKEIKK